MNQDFEIVNGRLIKYHGEGGDVIIPDGVTSIGKEAFLCCSKLKSVNIPDSVTSIGDSAFEGCSGLISVMIGSSVTNIGNFAFLECSSLTSVNFPDSLRSIESWAFRDCRNLDSAVIPDDIEIIEYMAFSRETKVIYHGIRFIPDESGIFNVNAMIWGVFRSHSDDEKIFFRIQKNFVSPFCYLIDQENIEMIQKVLDSEKFITKKNIDELIRCAIDQKKYQIQIMLTDYKQKKNWYQNIHDIDKKLKL